MIFISLFLLLLFMTFTIIILRRRFLYHSEYKNLAELYDNYSTEFLPPMSFNQIISLMGVPELNIKYILLCGNSLCLMDTIGYYDYSDKFLLVYYSKEKEHSKESCMNDAWYTIDLKNCIFIMPKTMRDYSMLRRYCLDNENMKKNNKVQNSQLRNLQEIKAKINEAQCNSDDIISDCLGRIKKWSAE